MFCRKSKSMENRCDPTRSSQQTSRGRSQESLWAIQSCLPSPKPRNLSWLMGRTQGNSLWFFDIDMLPEPSLKIRQLTLGIVRSRMSKNVLKHNPEYSTLTYHEREFSNLISEFTNSIMTWQTGASLTPTPSFTLTQGWCSGRTSFTGEASTTSQNTSEFR